jgi:ribosomal protein S18 acetylase RimI-like enzyme
VPAVKHYVKCGILLHGSLSQIHALIQGGWKLGDISICLKQYIGEEDYRIVKELKEICISEEKLFLKLELDFKISLPRPDPMETLDSVNEFFCFSNGMLIGYLGIFNMGGDTGELTGMVHPLYRRRGIFSRLYSLALEECKRRDIKKILLVCDNRSSTGMAFLRSVGAAYSFSEYEMRAQLRFTSTHAEYDMRIQENNIQAEKYDISVRKADDSDAETITAINYVCFGVTGYIGSTPDEEAKRDRITYMIERDSKVIGKIRTEVFGNEGFISGFAIYPEYRGRGYGRQALKAALDILNQKGIHTVALEVNAQNKNALHLYKSCGFVEESATDYFEAR